MLFFIRQIIVLKPSQYILIDLHIDELNVVAWSGALLFQIILRLRYFGFFLKSRERTPISTIVVILILVSKGYKRF